MAFGFPAHHEETFILNNSKEDFIKNLKSCFNDLNWSMSDESTNIIVASNKINFLSWGEKIIIKFFDNNKISVVSQCIFPIQYFDWGKNEKNVKSLLSLLNQKMGK